MAVSFGTRQHEAVSDGLAKGATGYTNTFGSGAELAGHRRPEFVPELALVLALASSAAVEAGVHSPSQSVSVNTETLVVVTVLSASAAARHPRTQYCHSFLMFTKLS